MIQWLLFALIVMAAIVIANDVEGTPPRMEYHWHEQECEDPDGNLLYIWERPPKGALCPRHWQDV